MKWKWVTLSLAAVLLAVVVGGMLHFRDAPIYPCPAGYCGKYGQVHPQSAYVMYLWWGRVAMALFGALFISLICWNVSAPSKK